MYHTLSSDLASPKSEINLARPAEVKTEKLATTASSHLVEVCAPRSLADYLANPRLNPIVRMLIIDFARERCGKLINQPLLCKSPGIGSRTCGYFRDATRELEVMGLITIDRRFSDFRDVDRQSYRYTVIHHAPTVHSHSAHDIRIDVPEGGCVWLVVDIGYLEDCLQKGRKALKWETIEATKASLETVTLIDVPIDDSELRALAETHIKEKKPRIKVAELTEKVDRQVAAIRAAERNPAGGKITRKSGRIYHRMTNLPKWARSLYVRICGEVPASVDIRCCYLWCLAADLRQRRLRAGLSTASLDRLLDMIEAGGVYERLAELAGMSTRGAKASFATLCLFGGVDEHFAANRLWIALRDICPDMTVEILLQRHRYGGASEFARHCQRMEGAIMLDGLLMTLHDAGVPCVTIHDGCLLRPQHRQLAVDVIKARTLELFWRASVVSE